MRAPNDREMQKPGGREVVEVAARADEEARVFLALDGHADRHARVAPRCASRFAWSPKKTVTLSSRTKNTSSTSWRRGAVPCPRGPNITLRGECPAGAAPASV